MAQNLCRCKNMLLFELGQRVCSVHWRVTDSNPTSNAEFLDAKYVTVNTKSNQ